MAADTLLKFSFGKMLDELREDVQSSPVIAVDRRKQAGPFRFKIVPSATRYRLIFNKLGRPKFRRTIVIGNVEAKEIFDVLFPLQPAASGSPANGRHRQRDETPLTPRCLTPLAGREQGPGSG